MRSSRSESGRPIWLFRFPLFLKTGKRADRNSATTSLVVVLPALPVIATTFAPERRRTSRARSCSAASRVVDLDDQRRRRRACLRRNRRLVDHRADGPTSSGIARRIDARQTVSPAIATKKSPGSSERESIDTRPIAVAGSPRTTRPPVAFATSVALKGSHSTCQHTRVPARRRASAVLATSTSSNGSTRSPITWYFS